MMAETDPTEEEAHVFYFRHFLLLEFVAAKYVATQTKVCLKTKHLTKIHLNKNYINEHKNL